MKHISTVRIPTSLSVLALSIIAINSSIISSPVHAEAIQLDSIIITGEKMDKSIKDTTTAVTVISEEDIEGTSASSVLDLVTQSPNVISDTFGNISIRGLSGGGAATGGTGMTTGSRARVSTVVDDVAQDWFGYNYTPSRVWDVEQTEVLRGPQSTVQGASAIGGALIVNTNDPTFEHEAAVRLGLESYENDNLKYNLAAMSSGALIEDELAYRIALDTTQGEGWLNYDTSDYIGDTPNLSDSENLNVRGKVLWEPSDIPELSAKLTVNHTKSEGEFLNFVSNTDEAIENETVDLNGTESRQQDSTVNSFSADIDYKLNSAITNSLHINHSHSDIYADGYLYSSYFGSNFNYEYTVDQTRTSIEDRLLFTPSDSELTGVVGLLFSSNDAAIASTQNSLETDYTTVTTALYGEGSYAVSNKAKAIIGLRLENEDTDKTGSYNTSGEINDDINETYLLPKLAMTYAVSDSTTLGASIRQGYNSGGTGIGLYTSSAYSFDSEEVTTVEFSSKSQFQNGATVSANLFYNDYRDYQAANAVYDIVNVDEATTYGVELEASAWLTDNLEVRGSVGLLQSEIDKYTDTSSYEGNDLSSAPETNINVGFTQYIGTDWSIGADAMYVGEYYSDLSNSDSNLAGDYTVINLNTQYTLGDLTINAYVSNLTDEAAIYFRSAYLAMVGQSRTIGINATYRM